MGMKQLSSSMKTIGPAKISASLPDDIKTALTLMVSCAACVALIIMSGRELSVSQINTLIWSAAGFSFCYSLILHVFRLFAKESLSVAAVLSLALLLMLLLWEDNIAIYAYVLWALIKLCPKKFHPEALICAVSSAVMIFTWIIARDVLVDPAFTWKMVFAALFVLVLSHLGGLIGYRDESRYPFAFFIVLLMCILIIPVRSDPINWEPLINAGKKAVEKTKEIGWSISYRFSDIFAGNAYSTGYSSFDQNGDSIRSSERTELKLKTLDNTTFTYTDEGSGQNLMRRRTVYLAGETVPDHRQLLDWLFAMYTRDVDHDQAEIFSRKANLDIRYVYLKTEDEILPPCPIKITDQKGNPIAALSGEYHKKGYRMLTDYLDIDYGSPYLEKLIVSPPSGISKKSVSFEKMNEYAYDVFAVRLAGTVSEDEYASWQDSDEPLQEYLDTSGATDRMRDLASQITERYADDYDKCRAIESYLRQFRYRTDTGTSTGGNTGNAEGMSRIADNFMFATGQGYCVHFASSMVMLLRLSGIPARLEGGYRYTFPFDRQEEYDVLASEAHVWPEAYVSGFGWIGFEPTSGMSTSRERTWHRQSVRGVSGGAAQNVVRPYIPVNIPSPDDSEDLRGSEADKGDMNTLMGAVRIVLIIAAAVILTAGLMIAGAIAYKAVKYKRAGAGEKFMMDVDDIRGIIKSAAHADISDRGIFSDYDPYIPEKYREDVRAAFEVYYRLKYRKRKTADAGDDVTQQEGDAVRLLRDSMRKEYSWRMNFLPRRNIK